MTAVHRSPCIALEWDWLSRPIDLDLTDVGDFEQTVVRATVQRTTSYGLSVSVTGTSSPSFEYAPPALKKGEPLLPLRPIVGEHQHEDPVHSLRAVVRVDGVTEERRTISGAGDLKIIASATSLEVTLPHPDPEPEACLVEWLLNFATDPELLPCATGRSFGEAFERSRPSARVTLPVKSAGVSKQTSLDHLVISVRVDGKDWMLTIGRPESGHCDAELRPGFLEYRSADGLPPDEATRDKVVAAISFALGRQLVPVGWTAFDSLGRPTQAASYRAHILGRDHMFSNPSMPPCRLAMNGRPIVDPQAVQVVTQAVLDLFQQGIDIEFPLWLTWLARSSPLDACAAHYGAAIEALRSRFFATRATGSTTLLSSTDWKAVRSSLESALDDAVKKLASPPAAEVLTMLRNNLAGINNKSSGAKYPEFFQLLDLPIDKVENAALRERNKPAHGTQYDPSQYVALKATVDALQTLFNRIVLKLAQCDRPFIDYSTYDHPIRPLGEPLGGPKGDRKPAL